MIVYGGHERPQHVLRRARAAVERRARVGAVEPQRKRPGNRYGHSAIIRSRGPPHADLRRHHGGGIRNDAWSLPLWKPAASWKLLQPLGTLPAVRTSAAADYDPAGGKLYVFGGQTVNNGYGLYDTWTLTLNSCAPPVITAQPVAATLPFGTTATFSVSATGAVGYRWQKGGVSMTDGGRITGTATASLSIASFQASDAGTYRVQVFGACDTVLSDAGRAPAGLHRGHANPPAHMVGGGRMDPGVGNGVPDVLNTKGNKNHGSSRQRHARPRPDGTALRCNGVTDGLHVPSTLSPELAKNGTGLTIDAWIYPRSGSSNNAFSG
jgi:hypothetical protein